MSKHARMRRELSRNYSREARAGPRLGKESPLALPGVLASFCRGSINQTRRPRRNIDEMRTRARKTLRWRAHRVRIAWKLAAFNILGLRLGRAFRVACNLEGYRRYTSADTSRGNVGIVGSGSAR